MYKAINPKTKSIELISEKEFKSLDIFDRAYVKCDLRTQVEMMREELKCTMIIQFSTRGQKQYTNEGADLFRLSSMITTKRSILKILKNYENQIRGSVQDASEDTKMELIKWEKQGLKRSRNSELWNSYQKSILSE